MDKIIGVDLSTTNSCVVIVEGSTPKMTESVEDVCIIPSIITYMKDGETLVGASVKRQVVINPKNTLYAVKRLTGRKFEEKEVRKDIGLMPYTITKVDNGDAWVGVRGQKLVPPWIPAEVLRRMKKAVEDYLGEKVTEAMITVLAHFNDSQRQVTKDAGRTAGLGVKRIINEPTAATLAFGLDKNEKGDHKIIAHDLGDDTSDISIAEIVDADSEKRLGVLSTNGDTLLGGENFDRCIINCTVGEFRKEQDVGLSKDVLALQYLKEVAEKVKIELPSTQQTEISLSHITADTSGPKYLNLKITHVKLEAPVEDLITRMIDLCRTAIKDVGVKVSDVHDVIPVGSMTRMPKVQEKVKEFFGKEAHEGVNLDEAAVVGATTQGQTPDGNRTDMLLLDVTSLSLGIETLSGVMTKMVSKNTTIPTKSSQTSSTADDNQSVATIKVCQGECGVVFGSKLFGEFSLEGIPSAPCGTPQIEMSFDIDANGILYVGAEDETTDKESKIMIKVGSGLLEAEIERVVKDAEADAEKDEKLRELIDSRNQDEALAYSTKKTPDEYGDELGTGEKDEAETVTKEPKETLRDIDKATINAKAETLAIASQKLGEKVYVDMQTKDEVTGAEQSAGAQTGAQAGQDTPHDDNIVDAEFKEVNDKK